MPVLQTALRYGTLQAGRRLSRSLPVIGGLIAVAALGAAIRRKGLFGGTLDTALNATPFVGAMKNTAEMLRGRDFISDRNANGTRR